MHEEPQVPNYGRPSAASAKEGLCIAIEPMVNVGGADTRTLDDQLDGRDRRRQAFGPLRAHAWPARLTGRSC